MSTRAKYPWDEWFSKNRLGENQTLVRGEDYEVQHYVMANMIRNNAVARNLRVSISIGIGGLTFSVRKPVYPKQHRRNARES